MNKFKFVFCVMVMWLMATSSLFAVTLSEEDTVAFNPKDFKIEVSHMQPQAYRSRFLSYGYYLALRNDTAFVHLPYMGRVYQPELTYDGLNFELPISDYKVETSRKGVPIVSFIVRKSFIVYTFQVSVQSNGRTDIYLTPSNAQSIAYDGELKEKK